MSAAPQPTRPPLRINIADWSFRCSFDVEHPLTKDEYQQKMREVGEMLAQEFKKNYPNFLFEQLREFNCLDLSTFK